MLLGLALRLYDLGGESLWLDEGLSLAKGGLPLGELLAYARSEYHPPLYLILLHGWLGLTGPTIEGARGFSALVGTVTIALLGLLAGRLFDRRTGLLAALFLALSTFHLHYSQEARNYALVGLFAVASALGLVRSLEGGRRLDGLGYALATALLLYTHALGFFVLLAQAMFVVPWAWADPARRPALVRWAGWAAVALLLYVPWAGVLLTQLHRVDSGFWIPRPRPSFLARTLLEWGGSAPGLLAYSVLGGLACWRAVHAPSPAGPPPEQPGPSAAGLSPRGAAAYLALGATVPLLGPYLLSLVSAPVYLTRVTLPGFLAYIALAAAGAGRLVTRPGGRILIAGLALIMVFDLGVYYRDVNKEPWRPATAWLDARARPGDLVLFDAGYTLGYCYAYYSQRRDLGLERVPPAGDVASREAFLRRLGAPRDRGTVWLVLSHSGAGLDRLRLELDRFGDRTESERFEYWTYGSTFRRAFVGIEIERYDRAQ